ncbi:MAG: ABC transporter ATP-binding protein [Candidatus Acidiferrales bacterium]
MNNALEFVNVVRAYVRGVPVLNGVTFSVTEGEVVGLLGRNGSGKTTLIHIALGMLFPQAGSVRVFGVSPSEHAVAIKRRIGYVAEEQVLSRTSSVAELIALHRYLFRLWDDKLEREILDRFGLHANNKILGLSKGQARAVALLCAVCHRPELLILDEPAAGLDPAARREFLEVAIQLLNRAGTTILFSSHYMGDIERIGSRVVVLDDGTVFLDSSVDRLREEYCVALVPTRSVADAELLARIPGYVRAREHYGDWHTVFQGTPEAVKKLLEQSLGSDGIRCERTNLEELFVELMGSKQEQEP